MVMPRLNMRKIQELLRLRFECLLSHSEIAASIGCSSTAVGDCLSRHRTSGLGWPLPAGLNDAQLEAKLYNGPVVSPKTKLLPAWPEIAAELKKKHVTLQLLWAEYRADNPGGVGYTQFCHHFQQWKKTVDLPFRNDHRAGERAFIDYAGQTVPIYDPLSGEVRHAQIFIAVLGASSYTFAEATWSQSLADWVASHNRMFSFFGGVPEILTPDNLKSAVTKACRYDPLINSTYFELAKHYKTAVIPARKGKPKDKAKAEAGVLLVERWILAALRNRKFFSLDELNTAIAALLEKLNNRRFQKMDGSRRSFFEKLDQPALKPLPTAIFDLCEFKFGPVNINYHVEVEKHFYSVPHQYVQKEVEVRYTAKTIEVLFKGTRIASHRRSFKAYGYTTLSEHMPENHQAHVKWTPTRMINWVGQAGPSTTAVAKEVLKSKPHPQQAFTSILGMIRLGEKYGNDRLEQASFRALKQHTVNYKSLKNILEAGLDQTPIARPTDNPIEHTNIRGPDYYR